MFCDSVTISSSGRNEQLRSGGVHFCFAGNTDSEIRMVDPIQNLTFWDKMGHGTTLGRPFGAFRVPTKIL